MQAQLEQLTTLIPRLPQSDQQFANGIIASTKTYGITPKRRYWIGELIRRASVGPAPRIDNFAGIIDLFQIAAKSLAWPKIRLRTRDYYTICLAVCGERSRHPGAINLTDGEGFKEGIWWGRIERNGLVTLSQHGEGIRATLTELLQRLSSEPAKTAAEYGKLTGCCTFCNRPLEDARSTAVGYGPQCAKSFRLPWGTTATPLTQPQLI